MKIPKILLFTVIFIAIQIISPAQELSQTVRGKIVDSESQISLPFVSVIITTTNPAMGTTADEAGRFRLENVPVGRHEIHVKYMGYETKVIPELMISTGKEIVLNIKLKEQIAELDEVVVNGHIKKDKALNNMSTVSARTFSVEEARRYAGGIDDPARLASSFAGVTSESLRDNTIVIRGNSPKGLLWRLEGVEISNPNHFSDMSTFGGGGVSGLSALVVANSDFFTGAFPAEYGNALSGVFDIKLRKGNNQTFEHAVQIGSQGLDLSSEGPLGIKNKASYLFNYRYSTFGLIKNILPEEIKDFVPVYQDLSFKFNLPTQKAGIFSLWGMASECKSDFNAVEDSSLWEQSEDRIDGNMKQRTGVVGLNHRYIFKKHAYINTSIAATGNSTMYKTSIFGYDMILYDYENTDLNNFKYTLTSVLNYKFNAKHSNRTGFIVNNLHYNTVLEFAPVYDQGLISFVNEKDASNTVQVFSQSKFNLLKHVWLNVGLHTYYFDLNKEFIIEPRLGLTYKVNNMQSVSLAYGKHSKTEPLQFYYAKVSGTNGITQPNKDMKLSKSHHMVFAYDISFNQYLRLKIEPYIQLLYDVPVIPDSNFSVLNLEADWYFNQELINTGTGKNIGIDLTFERFMKKGFYYLITASLFDSKYKGDDGIEHNTRFNTRYVFNILAGKEWILGSQKNKILSVNLKLNVMGGKQITPVDDKLSVLNREVVYDYSQMFEDRDRPLYLLHTTINYRKNKKKHSRIWSLGVINLLLTKENYGLYFNYKTNRVERFEFAVMVPNLSYKIEF